jgi:hypothetical protein
MSNVDQISARVDRLEGDHRALPVAFGAAFVVLLAIFGGGFMAIASKLDAGFAASAQRDEAITASIAEVRTDVAVLKERVPARSATSRDAVPLD